eukprot:COSAG06_NODE_4270_length_4414_cov_7.279490_2_plen_224_part_00
MMHYILYKWLKNAVFRRVDRFLIVFFTVVGLCVTGNEAYAIYSEKACVEEDARDLCDPSLPLWEQMYGRLMIIIMTMFLYLAKAGVQWVNKMTMFNERLIKTLFFRVIDNNRGKKTPFLRHIFINALIYQDRLGTNIGKALKKEMMHFLIGALAVMLHEAEMQEQREALLCYFFLHFRWLGPDDNRFERRPKVSICTISKFSCTCRAPSLVWYGNHRDPYAIR